MKGCGQGREFGRKIGNEEVARSGCDQVGVWLGRDLYSKQMYKGMT